MNDDWGCRRLLAAVEYYQRTGKIITARQIAGIFPAEATVERRRYKGRNNPAVQQEEGEEMSTLQERTDQILISGESLDDIATATIGLAEAAADNTNPLSRMRREVDNLNDAAQKASRRHAELWGACEPALDRLHNAVRGE